MHAQDLSRSVPHGFRRLADQLLRASSAVPLLISEGVNRSSNAQRRQRFVEAQGEAAETAAAVEILEALEFVTTDASDDFQDRAARIAAMLTGLIRHHS